MLSEDERNRIRVQINERVAQTEQSIQKLLEQVKPVSADRAIGRITRMDAIQQKSMAEANLREAKVALLNLEAALGLLDNPTFGLCILCQKPIALERILALPQVKKCIHCAQ